MVNDQNIKQSLRIEYLSTGWMVLEFVVGLYSGISAGSILLIAFGMDSMLELISGSTLIWRLKKEAAHEPAEVIRKAEKKSSLIVGTILSLLAVYVTVVSIYNLVTHQVADASFSGILIAITSLILMPILAIKKRKLGQKINSEALIEDGMCNITCAYMAATVLVGVIVTALFNLWWIDSVAALVLVYFIASEGIESLRNGLTK